MEIVKCESCGKHFDIETYPVCPNCGGAAAKNTTQQKTGFGLFKRKKQKNDGYREYARTVPAGHTVTPDEKPVFFENPEPERKQTVSRPTKVGSGTVSMWEHSGTTVSGGGNNFSKEPRDEYDHRDGLSTDYDYGDEPEQEQLSENRGNSFAVEDTKPQLESETEYESVQEKNNDREQPRQSGTLSREIEGLSASSVEKTVSFFDATMSARRMEKKAEAGEVAASPEPVPGPAVENGPVVGWLVCVKGAHLGQSFPLHMGKNTIGRSEDNDIILSKDNTVSRQPQASIVYEPQRRDFFLVPRFDGNNLVYLNKEYTEGKSSLKDRDLLEIGASTLMFVRLCGDDFSWEEYI